MKFEKIAIIGAGIMGHSIAQLIAQNGKKVILTDISQETLEKAHIKIKDSLTLLAKKDIINEKKIPEIMARINYYPSLTSVADADLIIEAIPEKIELKAALFEQLEKISKKGAVWASNTSGIPINTLATLTDRPELFVGIHFFMPAHLVPLVEVIQGSATKIEVVNSLLEFMTAIKKSPVHVKIDLPGFIGNRLQHAIAREAMSLLQKGVASMQDIDKVVKTSLAIRMIFTGPLEQRDLNGLDTHLSIAEYLYQDLENTTAPLEILSEKVKNGDLGLKTGKGFYDWSEQLAVEVTERKNEELISILKFLNIV